MRGITFPVLFFVVLAGCCWRKIIVKADGTGDYLHYIIALLLIMYPQVMVVGYAVMVVKQG